MLKSGKKVACIGDYMLDQFIYGDVDRISPEAPIQVLHQKSTFYTLGGAGNVVRNLDAFEQETVALGVIDHDFAGSKIVQLFQDLAHIKNELIQSPSWLTPHKTRLSSNGQQLLRLDHEHKNTLTKDLRDLILNALDKERENISAIVLSDYDKGNLSKELCAEVIQFACSYSVPVIVDPKDKDFAKYEGATLLTPNFSEIRKACGKDIFEFSDIAEEVKKLKEKHHIESMIVTLGGRGMIICEKDLPYHHIPTQARDVFDVSGAGDTVLAGLVLGLSEGKTLVESAGFANKAAGIVVGKIGTAVVSRDEVEERLHEDEKIMTLLECRDQMLLWKKQKKVVGFTNGCFDLLHLGHLHLLRQAKTQCDKLIVAVNSDSSVKRLKGESRPIQNEGARSQVLAALELVDGVVIFEEDTPLRCIETLLPNVLIKGADYQVHQVVGADVVQHNGGRVFLAELKDGFSTTGTVHKMKATA